MHATDNNMHSSSLLSLALVLVEILSVVLVAILSKLDMRGCYDKDDSSSIFCWLIETSIDDLLCNYFPDNLFK